MKRGFVKTENYNRFRAAVLATEQRGAAEAGMMLAHGQPGYGKSTIVYNWAIESGAIFLRANQGWTPNQFLRELAKSVRVDPTGRVGRLFERLLEHIVERQTPIVIDEAEFALAQSAAVLEKVRDLSDRAEVTVVLIGMETIQSSISKHKQISSRIAQVVEFLPATEADVLYACNQLCDYDITAGMAQEIHRLSQGRMREVVNIIAEMERLAKTNGITGALDVPHFAGVALAHDWQSRTAKRVRRA